MLAARMPHLFSRESLGGNLQQRAIADIKDAPAFSKAFGQLLR
jgi:hypothetical protein